jgi:hypothetical protein
MRREKGGRWVGGGSEVSIGTAQVEDGGELD